VRATLSMFIALCALGFSWPAPADTPGDEWRRADAAILRLSPASLPGVPAEIRAGLEARGCSIPQPYDAQGQAANAIRGAFAARGEPGWAVLCSRDGRSAILVFSGPQFARVEELSDEPDRNYLQMLPGERQIGYSRRLATADSASLRHRRPRRSGALDHDGIADAFIGKASVIWYRSGGEWTRLGGAD